MHEHRLHPKCSAGMKITGGPLGHPPRHRPGPVSPRCPLSLTPPASFLRGLHNGTGVGYSCGLIGGCQHGAAGGGPAADTSYGISQGSSWPYGSKWAHQGWKWKLGKLVVTDQVLQFGVYCCRHCGCTGWFAELPPSSIFVCGLALIGLYVQPLTMQLPGVATRGSSLSGLCEVLGHPEAVPAQAGSWLWACTWPPHWLPGLCTRKSSTSGGEQWALFLVLLPTVYMLVDLPLGGQTGTWAEPVLGTSWAPRCTVGAGQ